ncbi:hypothetical protein QBC34DRAFT_294246 [Podospora aff. communis PSN243]|uniref:G domain-containing protein n=1 Tax=Podospora aff. communis PSN243 TaxID=3040156 RepID=A0AAV9GX33_9PEZI|nr:hypothetical protein QBC34DRAFT_294246 [Podospora aff. communis PSN243]
MPDKDFVILLLGPMRSGKTSFVKHLNGEGDVNTCKWASGTTTQCNTHKFELSGTKYRIIDTPGLEDAPRSNLSVLKMIAAEMDKIGKEGLTIGGVVYFHRITNLRLTGSDRANIEIFERICGSSFLYRAAFATTMWNTVGSRERSKFSQLHTSIEKKYAHLTKQGTEFFKFETNKRNSAEPILQFFASASSRSGPRLQLEGEVMRTGLSATSIRRTEAGKGIVRQMNGGGCTIL